MAEDAAAGPSPDLTPPAVVGAAEVDGTRSSNRRGLKREFAFVIKANNDLSSPAGRTRSGKIRRPPGPEPSTSAGHGGREDAGVGSTSKESEVAAPMSVSKPEDGEGCVAEAGEAAAIVSAPSVEALEELEAEKDLEGANGEGTARPTCSTSREALEAGNTSSIVKSADEESPIETVLPNSGKQVGSCNLDMVDVPIPIRVEEPPEEFLDAIDAFETDDGLNSVSGQDELRVENSAAVDVDMELCTASTPAGNVEGENTTRIGVRNEATGGGEGRVNSDSLGITADLHRSKTETAAEMLADSNSHENVLTEDPTNGSAGQNKAYVENAGTAVDQSQRKAANVNNTRGKAATLERQMSPRRITRSFLKTGTKSENEAKVNAAAANDDSCDMLVDTATEGSVSVTNVTPTEANGHANLKKSGSVSDLHENGKEAVTEKADGADADADKDAMKLDAINIPGGQNEVKVESTPAVDQSQKQVVAVTKMNGQTPPVKSRRVTRSSLRSMAEETPQTPVPAPDKDESGSVSTKEVISQAKDGSRLVGTSRGRPKSKTTVTAQVNGGSPWQSMAEGAPQLSETRQSVAEGAPQLSETLQRVAEGAPQSSETMEVDEGLAGQSLAEEEPQPPATTQMKKEFDLHTPSTIINLDDIVDDEKPFRDSVSPTRRFTRSLLRSKVNESPSNAGLKVDESPSNARQTVNEPPPMNEAATVSSNETSEESDAKSTVVNGPNGSLSTPLKAKMELKMSKKITLTKLPANVRDLLGTGLLDGLNVTYVFSNNRQPWLRGVIKNGAILCYCSSCKGNNAVSAYQFELHAGSTKKHPSDYILLDNGTSINDIIRACARAPLDMLETTIRSVISSETNKGSKCQQCNKSFQTSRVGKLASICESCLVERLSKSPLPLVPSERVSRSVPLQKKTIHGRMTTKDLWLHKLVFMNETLPDGTEVAYYNRGKRSLEGYIKGSGIFCSCCSSVVSPSQFEAHAGFSARRKPYLNIYTSNGVSLHELSLFLSKDKKYTNPDRGNDDLCQVCADGGSLLLCDLCPRAFHQACVGLSSAPTGKWCCPCCQTMHQREKYVSHNINAIAAGRVSGVDPIEQIFKRCIRIVQTPEIDASCCVLCRGHDFTRNEFGPRTVLLCDQCEKEFHIGCLKEHNIADLEELPQGTWFCCSDCDRIYAALHTSHIPESKQISDPLMDVIKRKRIEKGLSNDSELDVRWMLIKGSTASPESNLLLSEATAIFHESFDPIIDAATRQDLIPAMVYGKDIGHQDFTGMYCAVLTVSSTVVSAGLLRILGRDVAELPLVATSMASQSHGLFQTLFSCIEELLVSLGVERLVLPATKEAVAIWINKFGFEEINQSQLEEYAKGTRPLNFQGTPMLHKPISCSEIQNTAEG